MNRKSEKKEKLMLPYKEILVEGVCIGRLYLVGSEPWNQWQEHLTVILSISKERQADALMSLVRREGFFYTGGNVADDVAKTNRIMFGTLRRSAPIGGNGMGVIAYIAGRMGMFLQRQKELIDSLPF